MTFHILFWALCAVLAAHVAVAIIAIAKAYRDERKLAFSTQSAPKVLRRPTEYKCESCAFRKPHPPLHWTSPAKEALVVGTNETD
jgi:hypothetical protein